MTETAQNPKSKWRYLLVASLALNLALIGMGAGFALKSRDDMARRPAPVPGSLYLRALSHQDKRELGKAMRKNHAGNPNRPNEDPAGFELAITALRQVPFNVNALRDVMEQQSTVSADRLDTARQLLLDHLSKMTDAERAAYADELQKMLRRR